MVLRPLIAASLPVNEAAQIRLIAHTHTSSQNNRLPSIIVARQRKIDVQTPTEVPARAPANRPRCVRVLKYIMRSYSSENVGNQKESKM